MLATVERSHEETDAGQLTQIEKILHSETLRTSEALRHLLSFLAEKTFAGEADGLKEYTVALEALQKPATYDPRHDSTVRLQVSRLRQKLAEYYRSEGKDDLILVDLPKGRFRLMFESVSTTRPVTAAIAPEVKPTPRTIPVWLAMTLWLTLLIPIIVGEFAAAKFRREAVERPHSTTPVAAAWTPDMEALWSAFTTNNRPLILGIEDPLFIQVESGSGLYLRARAVDTWEKLNELPVVNVLRKALNNPATQPSHYYTTVGEVNAALLVGKLFATKQQNISLVRASALSWQQLADNNILLVGKQTFFDAQLRGIPVHAKFAGVAEGVKALDPAPGDVKLFEDHFSMAPTEEGEVYALVTRLPGPGGKGEFESFLSNRAAGYVGALQWFSEPRSARILASKLKDSKGEMFKSYQVVLKIRFKDEIPTEISYVIGTELN